MMPRSLIVRCLLLISLFALPCTFASAQNTTATLGGTVVDPNGAVVPGANITLTEVATGIQRTVSTNDQGYFTIPLLKPSTYSMLVAHEGFTTVEVREIVLNVNDERALRIPLKTGDIKETVNITGEATLINQSPAVGTTVDRQFVANLPLNGRSFQSLILLTPGVVAAPTNSGSPGQFSVNGQRSNANYFTVDGVSANTGTFNVGSSPTSTTISQTQAGVLPGTTTFGGTNGLVSIDALEEFKIQTSTYSAEYGRQSGGQVSVVTRSGGNQFHGSVFDYLRNDVFDANDWFANSAGKGKSALRQNMFGGNFSGPLYLPRFGEGGPAIYNGKNRTFFFFSYEGLRLLLPQANVLQVPSLRVRQTANSAIRPILAAFPLPTGPEVMDPTGLPLGTAPFTGVYSDPSSLDTAGLRIDHTVGSRLTLFGRVNLSSSSGSVRNLDALSQIDDSKIRSRDFTVGATAMLTTKMSNDFRFNIDRTRTEGLQRHETFGGAAPIDLATAISPSFTSSLPNVLSIFNYSLPSGSGILQIGPGAIVKQRQLNLVDNLSLVQGEHQLKFGVDYRRLTPIKSPTNFQNVIFSDETGLQTATASLVQLVSLQGVVPIFTNLSLYGQDRWQASRRMTLDFGLRWEINPAPGETQGRKPVRLTGLDNLATAQLAPDDAPIYETDLRAFAPRFGAAYRLSDKTGRERVVRGGIGVFYDTGNGPATLGYYTFPFLLQTLLFNSPVPLIPSQAVLPSPIVRLPITQTITVMNPQLKLPYSLEWNVAVEQSLGTKQVFTASYVGSAGHRLMTSQTTNRPIPGIGLRPNRNFATINIVSNAATSNYQALQLQFQRRLSSGLQALFNYTWSHAIDEISDETTQGRLARGNSNFDVRHNFSGAVSYDLAGRKGHSVLDEVVRGWGMDGIIHVQSALPVDLSTSGSFVLPDGSLLSRRPNLVQGVPLYIDDPSVPGGRRFNSAAFKVAPAGTQGNFGRNVMRGLPLSQVDLALRRRIGLTENVYLQVRAEAFNIFNHPNFGGFGTSVNSPSTFGVATQMLGRSLGGLSPLYQIGGPRSLQFSLRLGF